ncbi:MAG: YaaR family protein [Treponema sp.]|jgi:uncharacterized protein YaaR (DUF327 family)|nr:YaaR family protein [Treponema sp.]
MAKVDFPPDSNGTFLDPLSYAKVNPRSRTGVKRGSRRPTGTDEPGFSSVLEQARTAGAEPAPPVSGETVNRLLEEIRNAGDVLRERPSLEEILAYKKAVRDFIRYVVDNGYQVEVQQRMTKYQNPAFSGGSGGPERQKRPVYNIRLIDRKLDELAAMILNRQLSQLELLSRLEEIRGLLIDLFS